MADELDPDTPGLFGRSIDVDSDTMVVGAPEDDTLGADAGAVYVYRKENNAWTFVQKLYAADGEAGDKFGYSVAVHQNAIAVGAIGGDLASLHNVGSAYVFGLSGSAWSQVAELYANDAESGNQFGHAVDILVKYDGYAQVLVGDPLNDNTTRWPYADPVWTNAGAAYEFQVNLNEEDHWDQAVKWIASPGSVQIGAHLGATVAFLDRSSSRPRRFVGAPMYDVDGTVNSGAVFNCDDPNILSYCGEISQPSPQAEAQFGRAIATAGEDMLIVGEPYRDGDALGSNTGSVYQYRVTGTSTPVLVNSIHADDLPGATPNTFFGYSIAGRTEADGTLVTAIGAPGAIGQASPTGGVYLNTFGSSGSETSRILLNNLQNNDFAGGSVGILENEIVTGAWRSNEYAGRVHTVLTN